MPNPTSTATPDGAEPQRRKPLDRTELKRRSTRLALIYALLDLSEQICLEYLEAALAVWRYSADSAAWIFGDTLGDPTADEIWTTAKERPAGVTRTEVSDLFSRNKKRREIERALAVLEDAGRLRRETRSIERGRSAEIWIPVIGTTA